MARFFFPPSKEQALNSRVKGLDPCSCSRDLRPKYEPSEGLNPQGGNAYESKSSRSGELKKKREREAQMKRHQMPATTLSAMKKVAFTILCCMLLVLFAAPAWADQCSGALPVGSATGCGALITVTAVDPKREKRLPLP